MTSRQGFGDARRFGARKLDHLVNDLQAIFLVALVLIAPVPLGSNRPAIWMALTTVIALLGVWYFAAISRGGRSLRCTAARLGVPLFFYIFVCGSLLFQILPIGGFWPLTVELMDGRQLPVNTLSVAPGATWLMLLQMLSYGLFFFLVLQVAVNADRALRMLAILFVGVVLHATFGIAALTQFGDSILGLEKWAYEGVATGTFVNRNSYATFLAFGATIGSSLLLGSFGDRSPHRQTLKRFAIAVGLFLIILALFSTSSRMGLLAALAGVATVVLMGAAKLGMGLRIALFLPMAAALVLAVLAPVYGTGLLERLLELEGAAGSRLELYRQVWSMTMQRPLIGYGGGTFEAAFPLYRGFGLVVDYRWTRAHSTYLALWAELGLVVGSLLLIAVGILVARTAAAFFRSKQHWVPAMAAIGVTTVAAIHSLVDFSLEVEANALAFLFCLSLGVAAAGTRPNPSTDHVEDAYSGDEANPKR